MLASKVNRDNINEMLLKEEDVFHDTPKYRAITKRLYQPFELQAKRDHMEMRTADEEESIKDLNSVFWGAPTIKRQYNRHRWKV